MANSGCHTDAAGAEALFVRNFAGYDYIVGPSGSCIHHVRENLTAIPQTDEVKQVRENAFELVEFLHDVLGVREFPWAEFPHKVGLHNGCATLRALRTASMSELNEHAVLQADDAAVGGQGHRASSRPSAPTNAAASAAPSRCSRSRCRRSMGYDKVQRPPRAPAPSTSSRPTCRA